MCVLYHPLSQLASNGQPADLAMHSQEAAGSLKFIVFLPDSAFLSTTQIPRQGMNLLTAG